MCCISTGFCCLVSHILPGWVTALVGVTLSPLWPRGLLGLEKLLLICPQHIHWVTLQGLAWKPAEYAELSFICQSSEGKLKQCLAQRLDRLNRWGFLISLDPAGNPQLQTSSPAVAWVLFQRRRWCRSERTGSHRTQWENWMCVLGLSMSGPTGTPVPQILNSSPNIEKWVQPGL